MSESTDPRVLTGELLAELDERLRKIGAPITEFWRPGLDEEQMDALTSEIGLSLSAEARVWWGWHDGIDAEVARGRAGLGPSWDVLSLAAAVKDAARKREMAERWGAEVPGDPRSDWPASWISLCGDVSYPRFACDCASSPSPIHYFDPEYNDDPRLPKLPSIGELVYVWLDALNDGTWQIDGATGEFAYVSPDEIVKVPQKLRTCCNDL